MPFETAGQRTGEFLVAHAGGLTPQALHPPHLLSGEVVSVPDERAFETLPAAESLGPLPPGLLGPSVRARAWISPPSGTSAVSKGVSLSRPAPTYTEPTSSLSRDSTTGQDSNQCLSAMVTTTLCPTRRYSPLTISWEKRPEPAFAEAQPVATTASASPTDGFPVAWRVEGRARGHSLGPYAVC
jgi:hypothetical protein